MLKIDFDPRERIIEYSDPSLIHSIIKWLKREYNLWQRSHPHYIYMFLTETIFRCSSPEEQLMKTHLIERKKNRIGLHLWYSCIFLIDSCFVVPVWWGVTGYQAFRVGCCSNCRDSSTTSFSVTPFYKLKVQSGFHLHVGHLADANIQSDMQVHLAEERE